MVIAKTLKRISCYPGEELQIKFNFCHFFPFSREGELLFRPEGRHEDAPLRQERPADVHKPEDCQRAHLLQEQALRRVQVSVILQSGTW